MRCTRSLYLTHAFAFAFALALSACADATPEAAPADEFRDAAGDTTGPQPPATLAVIDAIQTLPGEGLWPRFEPARVPVALFDGVRTLLIAHPAPPADFTPLPDAPGVYAFVGRHPAVRGNMPTEIAGTRAAAVLLTDLEGLSAERAAATVTHERFHVFQLEQHPDWTAHEQARFQYPATNAHQLFDRRLETLALHRSMNATTPEQLECWLRTGLILRRKRMTELPPAVAGYERDIERQEGLARYIERRAAGIRSPVDIPPNGFRAEDVRGRAYVTGEALAVMLDRFATGWRDTVDSAEEEPPPLDSLLWSALTARPEMSCGFSAQERADVLERAHAAVATMLAQRDTVLARYNAQPGWSVRVIAEAEPLSPQSLDPMSITRVGSATLVHERMLRAGNEAGYIDSFGRRALSTGYQDDPLGSGMREVLLGGLRERPALATDADGTVRLTAEGLEAEFRNAQVSETGQEIEIRLR